MEYTKYTRRNNSIYAIQFTGYNKADCLNFIYPGSNFKQDVIFSTSVDLNIDCGPMKCPLHYYIVKESLDSDTLSIMHPEEFNRIYKQE